MMSKKRTGEEMSDNNKEEEKDSFEPQQMTDFDLFRAVLNELKDDDVSSCISSSNSSTLMSTLGSRTSSVLTPMDDYQYLNSGSLPTVISSSSSRHSKKSNVMEKGFEEEFCDHKDIIIENNTEICMECGEEISKIKLSLLTDNQVTHASETKMRFVVRKSDDRTIFKDIESMGFSQRVITLANQIFQEVTLAAAKDAERRKCILNNLLTTESTLTTTTTTTPFHGNTTNIITSVDHQSQRNDLLRPEPPAITNTAKTYQGNSRKSIIFACVFHAFKILGQPRCCDYLINLFQISTRSALKGLKHVNKYAPKSSPLRTSYITPENLVEDIMDKIKATSEQKKEVVDLYNRISNRSSKLNRSRPKSVASGLTYYWIMKKQKNITLKEFTKKVKLSDLTVSKIASEISSIVATLDAEDHCNNKC